MGEDGEMHSVNGAFSRDGIVYITESTANGSLKDLNSVVGEEVGEIYAQNNGLENKNGKAQQIGEIFGEKISKGLDSSESKNKLTADNVDLTDVVIAGTNWLEVDRNSSDFTKESILFLIRSSKVFGYKNAVENVEHYLEGSGETKYISMDWYLNNQMGKKMITFIKWNVFDELDYSSLSNMNLGDYITQFKYDNYPVYPNEKKDKDLYYSMGPHDIDYSRNVAIKKIGENKYELKSQIDYTIKDKYDWKDGKYIEKLGILIDDSMMNSFKELGAKEYLIRGEYKLEFTAIFEMKNGKPVTTTNYTKVIK